MNSGMMATYIEFVADRLLVALGCDKFYRASNPFPWMEMISMQVLGGEVVENWRERRVSMHEITVAER